jgi:hypothetical protein
MTSPLLRLPVGCQCVNKEKDWDWSRSRREFRTF